MKAKFKCPGCGHEEEIEIPKDICLQFYKCKNCKKLIPTSKNECCVVCAYSDKKCFASVTTVDNNK